MKTTIAGDLHIKESAIDETASIVNEIMSIKADRLIQLGDVFDVNRPTPKEIKFATELFKKLKTHYKEVIVISGTGEHDLYHDTSIIEYLASLDIKAVRGDYLDEKENILCGHWMTNESRLEYGTAKHTIKELDKYNYVFLGHLHSYQKIRDNIYHLGSVRYVNWNESIDKYKRIALYDTDNENPLSFIELKTPYKMIDVTCNLDILKTLDIKTKVRYIFNSFEEYKSLASEINRLGKRFTEFKIKLNFDTNTNNNLKLEASNISSNKISIDSLIDRIEDNEVRTILKEQFKKTYDN